MQIIPTTIPDVLIIEPKVFGDDRGFFFESFNARRFTELTGVKANFVQDNHSKSARNVLRGMHYQAVPYDQAKLVRCTHGAIYDVGVDLRPESKSFRKWIAVELSAENRLMLYLPSQFGHGYLTLEDDTEVYYQVTKVYSAESVRGFRWDDPAFGIQWPALALNINQRDREYPDYELCRSRQ